MSSATIQPEDLPIGPFTRIVTAYPAFALPSASTTSTSTSSNKKGKIIGGVIGGVVGLLLLLALLYFLYRWRKRRSRTRKGHEELGDSDTAAPTPVQKQSEDRPQIAQVRGAVTVPPPAATGPTSSTGPTARTLTTDPATGERSSAYDTLAPLPTDVLSASPAGSPPGSSLGHGLAVPPTAMTGRPDSPLSFSSLRHARSPSLSSVLSDYVDASEIAATPISASESCSRQDVLWSASL